MLGIAGFIQASQQDLYFDLSYIRGWFVNLESGLGNEDLDGVFKDYLAGHFFTVGEEELVDV